MGWVFYWCLKQWSPPPPEQNGAVGFRIRCGQEETLCPREDIHYKTEALPPANLQSENPLTAEPEMENILGRSCTCCHSAFAVLFPQEDEKTTLYWTAPYSKSFWLLKTHQCTFPQVPDPSSHWQSLPQPKSAATSEDSAIKSKALQCRYANQASVSLPPLNST